jgi:hypothetical protein
MICRESTKNLREACKVFRKEADMTPGLGPLDRNVRVHIKNGAN